MVTPVPKLASLPDVPTGKVPVTLGGTGAATAAAGLNALMPAQALNAGKFISTDGTTISWVSGTGGTTYTPGDGVVLPVVPTGQAQPITTGRGSGVPCLIEPFEVYSAVNTTAVDAAYVTLDLSAWVPPGATVVWLELGVYSGGATSPSTEFHVRAVGDRVGGFGDDGSHFVVSVGVAVYTTLCVPFRLSPDRKVEYKKVNPSGTGKYYRIKLWGYQ